MNSYHFSLGNSAAGSVGFCASVLAHTESEAAAKLRRAVRDSTGAAYEVALRCADRDIEYVAIYFNPGCIRASDIDDAEPKVVA